MKTVQMSGERLMELISSFAQARIAVIGDFFLDKYLDVDPTLVELSVETGKVAHQVVNIRCSPGAAGTIVCNLAALGAGQLHAVGFTGDDGEGYDLRKELHSLGCSTQRLHLLADRRTPTYLKPRDTDKANLDAEHPRYDTKNRIPTAPHVERAIMQSLDELLPQVDAVIVQDQVDEENCGVVTEGIRRWLADRAASLPGIKFWADSRRMIRRFSRVIIKPNQFEAVGNENPLPGDQVPLKDLVEAAQRLRSENEAPVVVTRGPLGMVVSDPQWTLVPAVQVHGEIDPTGAGDSATAGSVLALCAEADLPEAALVGNLVASITIEQMGTTGVARPSQLPDRLAMWQSQQRD